MTPYCGCKHAMQVHTPADGSLCRGLCPRWGHTADTHTGPCTAQCLCVRYQSVSRDRPPRAHQREAPAPLVSVMDDMSATRGETRGGGH